MAVGCSRDTLNILLVSTPIGFIGSGKGGGVEQTLPCLISCLMNLGHRVTAIVPAESQLPSACEGARIWAIPGNSQASMQHFHRHDPISIPAHSLLGAFWHRVLQSQGEFDAIVNLSYDWLPFWLSPHVQTPLFHLVSMGSLSEAMDQVISDAHSHDPRRIAFLTNSQAADFPFADHPIILGHGLNLDHYRFRERATQPPFLAWAGRIAPEKGLEDAIALAKELLIPLHIWGAVVDPAYAHHLAKDSPAQLIHWRGFQPTHQFQEEMGGALAFINTPKWNEAFGIVVVEALACGVPIVAYRRGGPSEIVQSGRNGYLVDPDDCVALTQAAKTILHQPSRIPRIQCRRWAEENVAQEQYGKRFERWLRAGISQTSFLNRHEQTRWQDAASTGAEFIRHE